MLRPIKHLILIGNSAADLLLLAQRLTHRYPKIACSITDIRGIKELCDKQPPDMIFVYVTDGVAYFPYVRAIRQQRSADAIPVLVCRAPLTAGMLEEMLQEAGWLPA